MDAFWFCFTMYFVFFFMVLFLGLISFFLSLLIKFCLLNFSPILVQKLKLLEVTLIILNMFTWLKSNFYLSPSFSKMRSLEVFIVNHYLHISNSFSQHLSLKNKTLSWLLVLFSQCSCTLTQMASKFLPSHSDINILTTNITSLMVI